MALTPGTTLGAYEIVGLLGAGGMGEVYRARDTRLGRDVAIKVLPDLFVDDPERVGRFQREAQVLASLNHPHIAGIYGFEQSGATRFLAMELVEGESLAHHLVRLKADTPGTGAAGSVVSGFSRTGMAVDEALDIARQIAEALEAAHEKGIIHRDLKPANIMLTADGRVKVLDFGLAKIMERETSVSSQSMSPTLSMQATFAGTILGTAGYMSPEQARGKATDKRSDVWAFGCVLYEMIAGRRAFEGEDITDTIAAVVRGDPDWSALPPDLPPRVGTIVRRCLEKDRKQRFADISVALFLMNEPREAAIPVAPLLAPSLPRWRRALPIAVSVVLAAAITSAAAWMLRPSAPSPVVTRFSIPLGEGQRFTNAGRQLLAISPDGTRIVYEGGNRLYLRAMSEADARPVVGTDSVQTTNPVFSPDGRSLAFWSRDAASVVDVGVLKRIAVGGGAAVTICTADNPFGMSWDGDEILFGQGSKGIMRVSANGGKPEVVVAAKSGEMAHGPQMLPGGQAVLFTIATASSREGWDRAHIVAQSLKTGERKTLVSGGADARYLPTGHIVYAVDGVAYAVRFDPGRLTIIGGPVPIIEGVARARGTFTGTAQFSTSDTGSLVYIAGPLSTSTSLEEVAFVDRQGPLQPLKLPLDAYLYPRVSPDGKRLAVETDNGKEAIVWIYDLSSASARRRLTFGGQNRFPTWSSDGERVAFQSDRDGAPAIFWQRADGSGTAERLTKPDQGTSHVPESWSPDGKRLLFSVSKDSRFSLSVLSLQDKQASAYGGVESAAPISAQFSPDGLWVAYWADDGLLVQPFPATGAKYQISNEFHPFWSPDGKELFSRQRGRTVVRAITTKPTFTFGNPVELPDTVRLRDGGPTFERNHDITPDGKRFVGVISGDQTLAAVSTLQIQVVENWFEELKTRVK
jgi:serine/threonine-protein kinase